MNKTTNNQKGFTIVELIIASAVFSMVLLVVVFGMLQIARVYYKGVTLMRTQENARSIIDEISRDIQFSGGRIQPVTLASPSNFFCIGDKRYSFITGKQLANPVTDASDEVVHVLVADTDAACAGGQNLSGALSTGSRELVAPNIRIASLTVTDLGTSNLYFISLRLVYGDKDLLTGSMDGCKNVTGSQFCAVSELSTTIQKRVQ